MILLINTLITERQLGYHYDRGRLDPDSRFDIFKYAMASHAVIPWTAVYIFCEMDAEYRPREAEMLDYLRGLYPDGRIYPFNNERQRQWQLALTEIRERHGDEPVWFLANNDHVFIDSDTAYLDRLLAAFKDIETRYRYTSLFFSHWQPFLAEFVLSRPEPERMILEETDDYYLLARRESGSAMIMNWPLLEHFWFDRNLGNNLHFRADYMISPDTAMMMPKRELVRHYDAYAHHGLDINKVPILKIPDGFFEGEMRIAVGPGPVRPGWTRLDPTAPFDAAVSPEGPQIRGLSQDMPLFWRSRVVETESSLDETDAGVVAARNRVIADAVLNHARGFSGDLHAALGPALAATPDGRRPIAPPAAAAALAPGMTEVQYKIRNVGKTRPAVTLVLLTGVDGHLAELGEALASLKARPDVEVMWLSLSTAAAPKAVTRAEAALVDSHLTAVFGRAIHKGAALNLALAEARGDKLLVVDAAYGHLRFGDAVVDAACAAAETAAVVEVRLFEIHVNFERQADGSSRQAGAPNRIPRDDRIAFLFDRAAACEKGGFDEAPYWGAERGGAFELADRMVASGASLREIADADLFAFVAPNTPVLRLPGSPIFQTLNRASGRIAPMLASARIAALAAPE
jgi:hypothetical protein